MDLADLETIAEASADRFRLEVMPTYLVPEEAEEFDAWRHGRRVLPVVDESRWLQHIRDTTAAGVRWWRVRILDYPLTDYAEYELHSYQGNATAGEDVFVANRAWSAELADLHDDFWIFDHQTVIRMIYDDDGHFLHPELASDTDHYLGIRSIVIRHAIALNDFLTHNEPRLIA